MTTTASPADADDSTAARPHDMGGAPAGAIDPTDHGLAAWENQANAMRMVMVQMDVVTLDELRRGAEDLPDYYRLTYFERTTKSIRNILLEKGVFTEAQLDAKMQEIRARLEASHGAGDTAE